MVVAGPNLSIDRHIRLERFDLGRTHRAEQVEVRIGGGGVNSARSASRLGAVAPLVTILPKGDEPSLADHIQRDGVSLKWIRCGGRARIATVLRERIGRTSLLVEPGAALSGKEWEAFVRLVLSDLDPGQVLLCTGSLPPGAPIGGYVELARHARHLGSRCVVDAAGATLLAIVESGEGIPVPNLAEAEAVLSGADTEEAHPDDAPERARAAAAGLIRGGSHAAVVTAGGAGAAYAECGPRGRSGWVPAPVVPARNLVGAGDAFAAGLALRIEAGERLDEAAEYAVAVAASHVVASTDGDFEVGRHVPVDRS